MEYKIYEFEILEVQKAQDWLNEKAKDGYVIVDVYYYKKLETKYARYTMERNN